MPSLPNYLRTNRKGISLTQEEVAFLLGLKGMDKGGKVSRDENDSRIPTLETAMAEPTKHILTCARFVIFFERERTNFKVTTVVICSAGDGGSARWPGETPNFIRPASPGQRDERRHGQPVPPQLLSEGGTHFAFGAKGENITLLLTDAFSCQ
jgi:hypothetical protein